MSFYLPLAPPHTHTILFASQKVQIFMFSKFDDAEKYPAKSTEKLDLVVNELGVA